MWTARKISSENDGNQNERSWHAYWEAKVRAGKMMSFFRTANYLFKIGVNFTKIMGIKPNRIILLAFSLLAALPSLYATHLMGGSMSYRYLGRQASGQYAYENYL
jgi:hypothetical protein